MRRSPKLSNLDAVETVVQSAAYREAVSLAEHSRQPAMVGNIRFGTAGWTDPSLVKSGVFYPPSARTPEGRLRHYARHFSMVEVDATYYSILAPPVAERWLAWTPDDFEFNIKAHSSLTGHPIELSRLSKALLGRIKKHTDAQRAYARDLPQPVVAELWDEFDRFVQPLRIAGKLGCIMLQFPPWFGATRGNARRIEELADRFGDFRLSVEFRNPSWLEEGRRQRVFGLLHRLRLCYVAVDEPKVTGGGVPPIAEVTNPELALFRFHGHNARGWRKGASVAEKFNYLYAPEELAGWAEKTASIAKEARRVHVVFNNCVRDFAVIGAKDLSVLVERRKGG